MTTKITITSRHRYIEYFINCNSNFSEQSFNRIFTLSEKCYEFVCSVLLDGNIKRILTNEFTENEYINCLSMIFQGFINNNNLQYAKIVSDHIALLSANDDVQKLMCEYRNILIESHNYKDDQILPTYDELVNNVESEFPIGRVITKLFNILINYRNISAYFSLVSIYNNFGKNTNNRTKTKYMLCVYSLDNECYDTIKNKDKLLEYVIYCHTVMNSSYKRVVRYQIRSLKLLDKYWNLAQIEKKHGCNDNNYAIVHYINYFYELYSLPYDDCILNYNTPMVKTIKALLCKVIYMALYDIRLQHESVNLLELSRININDMMVELHKMFPIDVNDILNKIFDIKRKRPKNTRRYYVEYCDMCYEYHLLCNMTCCYHKLCEECYSFLLEKKCPVCRRDIPHGGAWEQQIDIY